MKIIFSSSESVGKIILLDNIYSIEAAFTKLSLSNITGVIEYKGDNFVGCIERVVPCFDDEKFADIIMKKFKDNKIIKSFIMGSCINNPSDTFCADAFFENINFYVCDMVVNDSKNEIDEETKLKFLKANEDIYKERKTVAW
jgi:hypothetical protein